MNHKTIKIIRAVTISQSCCLFHGIMKKMKELGYEMVALSAPGPELDEIHQDDFVTIDVPMERHISLNKDIMSLLELIRVFLKEKPDVVHSMTPKAGLLCMIAAWLTGIPVRVHTFTGLVWPTSNGLKRIILKATDWVTCACATHIIPEGKGVMDDLRNGGITKKPMKVLGYGNVRGIDLNRFDPERFSREGGVDDFVFLFVGRIVGDKGINELVEAFTKLNSQNSKTKLILVGDYEESLDPIREITKQRITANRDIIVKSFKSGDDLVKEYRNADCFVMPSYREGFPNTVLEAGAMGLPCIVTDINGSREIITNGENGLIVPPKEVEGLYSAMEYIMSDSILCKKLSSNARSLIASRYDIDFVQKCLIDFYEEILGKTEHPSPIDGLPNT